MEEQYRINPLTLEAQLFANTLNKYGPAFNKMDINLARALENVLFAIDNFLNQNPRNVPEESTIPLNITQQIPFQMIYACTECNDIFKNPPSATRHLVKHLKNVQPNRNLVKSKNFVDSRRSKRREPVCPQLPKKTSTLLGHNVTELHNVFLNNIAVGDKLLKLPDYDEITSDLKRIVEPLFPEKVVKVYFFGSRMQGIGTAQSDLDVFLDIDGQFDKFSSRASDETIRNLIQVRNAARKSPKFFDVEDIVKARVPILKLRHSSQINCDISCSNALGFCNTNLIKYFLDLQPVAKKMCIFLKKWFSFSKIFEFTSYSVTLMVINFLQISQLLPSVESLQENMDENALIGPWTTTFMNKSFNELKLKPITDSLECKKLLKKFFEWYSNFNYEQNIICPYSGDVLPISQLSQKMPKRYVDYANENNAKLELTNIIVQDPIQLNHNVTKSIPKKTLFLLKGYFRQSALKIGDL